VRLLVNGGTATVRRLAGRYPDLLGHLLSPGCGNSVATTLSTGLPVAADNGAYSGFDPDAFRRLLRRVAGRPRLLWVVCPDRVGDARATLALFRAWEDEVRAAGPIAFVLQDGQEDLPLPDADCYFVGGSTRWKLGRSAAWLVLAARAMGKPVHMGRVNSLRRVEAAYRLGCASVDGTSMSRWGDAHLTKFCAWLRRLQAQPALW
jgi:hypothetical protein